jgi:hypothetical protein
MKSQLTAFVAANMNVFRGLDRHARRAPTLTANDVLNLRPRKLRNCSSGTMSMPLSCSVLSET